MTDRERLAEIERKWQAHWTDIHWLLSLVRKQDAKLEKAKDALEYISHGEPDNGGSGICTYCDMGGSGYSSKGDRHHDDIRHICPIVKAENALAELEKE